MGKFPGLQAKIYDRPAVCFDELAKSLHAPAPTFAIRSSEHGAMSYLLSSVDLTHAPAVSSLAPSTGSVFASSLGSLRIVRFLVLLHRAVHSPSLWYNNCCVVVRHDMLPLHFDLTNSGASNSTDPISGPAKLKFFNLLAPRVGRSCAKTNAIVTK